MQSGAGSRIEADLDTGWTGTGHNFGGQTCGLIPGDLGGCNPALGDYDCPFFANVGSFCSGDPSRNCTENTQCVGAGNCIVNRHGAPVPLSSGGVPVCVLFRFSGDITGTYNLQSGSTAFTMPLNAIITLSTDVNQPCPVCNCTNPPCDCGDSGTCSNNPLQSCTVGGVGQFGPTSNDCQPTGPNISGSGLAVVLDPVTSGTRTFPSSTQCTGSGFTQYGCWGPGETQPSACLNGCDGGSRDGLDSTVDGDCPGGVGAHPCRPLCRHFPSLDPGAGNENEGRCVLGPVDQTCTGARQINCTSNADCVGGTGPCQSEVRRCFMDPIVRTGVPGTSVVTLAAAVFIPATSSPAVNSVAGLPGPGSVRFAHDVLTAYCGDDAVNQDTEECDGTADANCPGACDDLTCKCNVVCGNAVVDFGEQCDGAGQAQCGAGQTCSAPGNADQCTCTPVICGDGFKAAAEQCDPGAPPSTPPDDDACPGECQPALCTCPAAVCGDSVIEGSEVCELPAIGCGALQACALCTACVP